MQKPFSTLGLLLLACTVFSACETRPANGSGSGRFSAHKAVVRPVSMPLVSGVHRHDDYRGGYYYESDRYARMTRWYDPVESRPGPAPAGVWAK